MLVNYRLERCRRLDINRNSKNKERPGKELERIEKRMSELEILKTKLKQTEEELWRFKTISDKAGLGIIICDLKGDIVYINEHFAGLLGYKTKKLIGKNLAVFLNKNQMEDAAESTKELLKKERFVTKDVLYTDKDGIEFPVLESRTIIKDKDGKPQYMAITGIDITDIKQTIKELKSSEDRLKILFEFAPDAYYLTDLKGYIINGNKAAEELVGYKREELIGNDILKVKLLSADQIQKAAEILSRNRRGEATGPDEFILNHKNGNKVSAEISTIPIKIGGQTLVLSIARNITERKLAEKEKESLHVQLVHSEKMAAVGTLASGIAHEFNNLLQIIIGNVQFAQVTKNFDERKESLDIILNASRRAAAIIKDLLFFSRKEKSEKEICDVTGLVDSVVSLTKDHFKKHNIKIINRYESIPQIRVNRGEMQQVFLNIITNARDAMMPKGGKLEIVVRQDKNNVIVNFKDTGIGIKKKNLSKVLEPFYTTKDSPKGDSMLFRTGLGLSVSYGIIKRHGGTIEVESQPGEGTTFTVKLPAKDTETEKVMFKYKRKRGIKKNSEEKYFNSR